MMDAQVYWPEAFAALAPELSDAVEYAGKRHVPCPVHGGKDGFRMLDDFETTGGAVCNTCGVMPNGYRVLAWLHGNTPKDAYREVKQWQEKGEGISLAPVRRTVEQKAPDYDKARAEIEKLRRESLDIQGTPVERYLTQERKIWVENIPPLLRYHPGIASWTVDPDTKKFVNEGTWPVMLAPVTNKDGTVISMHRTFLTPEGKKAPVADAKKLSKKAGSLHGCSIKLFPVQGSVLHIGEGIETMLAVNAITREGGWATVNRVLMESVHLSLPDAVETVGIWVDKDKSRDGLKSALVAKTNVEATGRKVLLLYPDQAIPANAKGIDWFDVLVTYGYRGFPRQYWWHWE